MVSAIKWIYISIIDLGFFVYEHGDDGGLLFILEAEASPVTFSS